MTKAKWIDIPKRTFRLPSILLFMMVIHLIGEKSVAFGTENPHKNMSLRCEACHISVSWDKVRYDHSKTKFRLEDRHREIDCKSCHNIEDFAMVSSDCSTCHEDVHQAKMGNDCQRCHDSKGWEIFDAEEIHANTRFPLMGKHALVDCASCHQNQGQGDFSLLTTDCISCHQSDYLSTENPNHVTNSFATTCQDCHEMNDWQPAFLANHDVFFPIFSGNHEGAWNDCKTCHENAATFSDFTCLACHEHLQTEMDQEHRGLPGYAYESTACLSCHPTGDKGEFKDHDNLFFPIFVGAHAGEWEGCFTCHTNPSNQKEFTCLVCHEHSQSEMDPKHSGITGYAYESSQCLQCHPTGESGEFRDHDNLFFPIFAGTHAGQWQECLTCHPNPASKKEFTCIVCHEHNQTDMDAKHSGITGYAYDSAQCLSCHPTGESGEFRDHDNLFFPIFAGTHAGQWQECLTCHPNPASKKEFTCIVCHEHNQTDMDATHTGIPGYAYDSSQCLQCHPTGEKGEFREHDNLFFPIFAGAHAGQWQECLTCHPNPVNRKEFTCVVCHEHNQTDMDTRHAGIPGYAFDSNTCFGCHPTGQKGDFDHSQYFPIARGPHQRDCIDCHVDPANFQRFECIVCHEHNQRKMDDKHLGKIAGYMWESNACLDCHPNGKS